jgi:hypothetical protein
MAKFGRIEIRGILKRPGVVKEILVEEATLMAGELADFGAERMREYIRERGTSFSAAAASAGINRGPGRIRTGNMYNSVSSRVESGGKRTLASFGWIKNFEEYFGYQESGFRNFFIASYTGSGKLRVVGGQPVIRRNPFGGYKNTRGMFALRDARADVENQVPKATQKYRSRITRKMNRA